jgi:hypothetical protein
VDASRDLPSLGPGATSLLDVSVPGVRQGDHASAVLMPPHDSHRTRRCGMNDDMVGMTAHNEACVRDAGSTLCSGQMSAKAIMCCGSFGPTHSLHDILPYGIFKHGPTTLSFAAAKRWES